MQPSSIKLSVLRRMTSILGLAATVAVGAANTGCIIVSDRIDDGTTTTIVDDGTAALTIDADAEIDVSPGDNVGVLVQYASGGHWNVFTSCDTLWTDVACEFDLFITPEAGSSLFNVSSSELEGSDVIELLDDGTLHLQTTTTTSFDGITFDTDPGALVEIYMVLDGYEQPEYFYSVGDGRLQEGAPTDPVAFVPSSF